MPQKPKRYGSSPRMRGARCLWDDGVFPPRIIPADAGSTDYQDTAMGQRPDHPRGCGEHGVVLISHTSRRGSSPRMRGALEPPFRPVRMAGIIPADAGSTCWRKSMLSAARWGAAEDHPRGCGEHAFSKIASATN